MSETRKLAAILVSDVVGYSRLAGTDEDRILARLRALRSDLIDPTIAVRSDRQAHRRWSHCRVPEFVGHPLGAAWTRARQVAVVAQLFGGF